MREERERQRMSEERAGRTRASRTRDRGVRESQGQGDQYASTGTRRRLREGGLETSIKGRTGPGAVMSGASGRNSWRQEAERRVEAEKRANTVRRKGQGEGVDAEGRATLRRAHYFVEARGTKGRQKEGGVNLSITMPSVNQSSLSGRRTRRESGRVGGRKTGAPMC